MKKDESKKLSRRDLIKTLGATGALVAAGGLVSTLKAEEVSTTSNNPHDKIGDLSLLETSDKSNLVNAVNENTAEIAATAQKANTDVNEFGMSVKQFGAAGDGVTDDTQAIQDGIDHLHAIGGGTLFFPDGVYIVKPHLSDWITLKSNVNLRGNGRNSCIKVGDDVTDYWTIFGNKRGNAEWVENVKISDIRIDQNVERPADYKIGYGFHDHEYWRQFCIGIFRFNNIVIERVDFDPTCAVNSVTINHGDYEASQDVVIRDCFVRFKRGKGDPDYDNSAFYLHAHRHQATGNRFVATVGERARGCIESHGGPSVIADNLSEGYYTMLNAVARSGKPSANMSITGNVIYDADSGIQLWKDADAELKNVTIANNVMRLRNADHDHQHMGGIRAGSGDGNWTNVTIQGNVVEFQKEENEVRPGLQTSASYGIGVIGSKVITGMNISNNTVLNAPFQGISLGNTVANSLFYNVVVQGNSLINCGINQAISDKTRRAGIYLRGTFEGGCVSDNIINDDNDALKGYYAFFTEGNFTDFQMIDNVVSAKHGSYANRIEPSISSDLNVKVKSTDKLEAAGTFETEDLVYYKGYEVDAEGKQPYGWRVTRYGTQGKSLNNVTVLAQKGDRDFVLSNAEGIESWDYIRLQGLTSGQVKQVLRVSGNEITMTAGVTEDIVIGSKVTFFAPVIEPLVLK